MLNTFKYRDISNSERQENEYWEEKVEVLNQQIKQLESKLRSTQDENDELEKENVQKVQLIAKRLEELELGGIAKR